MQKETIDAFLEIQIMSISLHITRLLFLFLERKRDDLRGGSFTSFFTLRTFTGAT